MKVVNIEKAYRLKEQLGRFQKDLEILRANKSYLCIDIIDRRDESNKNVIYVDDESPALAEFFTKYEKELEAKIEDVKKQIEAL